MENELKRLRLLTRSNSLTFPISCSEKLSLSSLCFVILMMYILYSQENDL